MMSDLISRRTHRERMFSNSNFGIISHNIRMATRIMMLPHNQYMYEAARQDNAVLISPSIILTAVKQYPERYQSAPTSMTKTGQPPEMFNSITCARTARTARKRSSQRQTNQQANISQLEELEHSIPSAGARHQYRTAITGFTQMQRSATRIMIQATHHLQSVMRELRAAEEAVETKKEEAVE